MVVAVEATRAPATWRDPWRVACSSGRPLSRSRTTLPETTMAPSTTMPTANASPAREMTFRLRPMRSSATKVAHRHTGMVAAIKQRHAPLAHEPPHHDERQQGTDDQVLGEQVHRAADEERRVEGLLDPQAPRLERSGTQFRNCGLHRIERRQYVRTVGAEHLHADGGIAVLVREVRTLRRTDFDGRDVGETHRAAIAPGEHLGAELLGTEAPGKAQRVLAATHGELTTGDIGGGRCAAGDVRDADPEGGRARKLEGDVHFIGRSAVDVDGCDARDRLQPRAHRVFDEATLFLDRTGAAGQQLHKEPRQRLIGVPVGPPRDSCGRSASRGSGGSRLRRPIASTSAFFISVPRAKRRLRLAPPTKALPSISSTPGSPCMTFSSGSRSSDSTSSGEAVRHPVWICISGRLMSGNSCSGRCARLRNPSSSTNTAMTITAIGLSLDQRRVSIAQAPVARKCMRAWMLLPGPEFERRIAPRRSPRATWRNPGTRRRRQLPVLPGRASGAAAAQRVAVPLSGAFRTSLPPRSAP